MGGNHLIFATNKWQELNSNTRIIRIYWVCSPWFAGMNDRSAPRINWGELATAMQIAKSLSKDSSSRRISVFEIVWFQLAWARFEFMHRENTLRMIYAVYLFTFNRCISQNSLCVLLCIYGNYQVSLFVLVENIFNRWQCIPFLLCAPSSILRVKSSSISPVNNFSYVRHIN